MLSGSGFVDSMKVADIVMSTMGLSNSTNNFNAYNMIF